MFLRLIGKACSGHLIAAAMIGPLLATIAVFTTPAAVAQADPAAGAVTFQSLMEEMLDLRRLAEFPSPAYTCRQFSSYDRASTSPDDAKTWFANRDAGHYLRIEENGPRREWVMMDVDGPGAVVRIWSANPKGMIRIYIDGKERPTIAMPMARMLGGESPLADRIAGFRSRGGNCYLPIPYAKHCTITTDDGESMYYQVNYRTYEPGTAVESFRDTYFGAYSELIAEINKRLKDLHGVLPEISHAVNIVHPGETEMLFEADSAGAVEQFRILLNAADLERALRESLLVMTFDGIETVRCPVGDFFASAPDVNPYRALPMEVAPDGTMSSFWFMPFAESASISFVNMSEQTITVRRQVVTADYQFNDRSMHFYAVWRGAGPVKTRPMQDFNFATVQGRGVWVGDALHMANPVPQWWGEGDEKIYIDGETFPSHFGTGTEDYYGYAWCNNETFSAPQHTQSRCDGPANFGFTSVNRFRTLDAIPFTSSLRFDMELWHWAETEVHYATTAYFYGRDVTHNVQPIADRAELAIPELELDVFRRAGAIEAEGLAILTRSTGLVTEIQTVGDGADGTWSGMRHLWCKATGEGQFLNLKVSVTEAGQYDVIAYFTRSWDYGIVQCAINGRPAGEPLDLFNTDDPNRIGVPQAQSLGRHYIPRVGLALTIKVVGTNPNSRSPHYYWGLDCIELRKVE